ncbi:hypothetical protein Emag_002433 [Eimeria magna]
MGNRLHRTIHEDGEQTLQSSPRPFCRGVLAFGPGGLHEALQSGNTLRPLRAPERPPPIEESTESLETSGDAVSQDWRWLALRSERRLNASMQLRTMKQPKLADTLDKRIRLALFFPLLSLLYEQELDAEEAQAAAAEAAGAAGASVDPPLFVLQIINQFFDRIIHIVHFWGGDIIKFSGDALTIVWPVDDDDEGDVVEDIKDDDEYRVDAKQACLLAAKCCMNLHQSLHKYPTGFAGKTLTLHIGAGFGETVLSPTMVAAMKGVASLEPVSESPPGRQFYRLLPHADDLVRIAQESRRSCNSNSDEGAADRAGLEQLAAIHKLADWHVDPPPPLAAIEVDADDVDLLRRLETTPSFFTDSLLLQEGSVNKFLVDDKGVLLLVMFGLPPVYHLDDPVRGSKGISI